MSKSPEMRKDAFGRSVAQRQKYGEKSSSPDRDSSDRSASSKRNKGGKGAAGMMGGFAPGMLPFMFPAGFMPGMAGGDLVPNLFSGKDGKGGSGAWCWPPAGLISGMIPGFPPGKAPWNNWGQKDGDRKETRRRNDSRDRSRDRRNRSRGSRSRDDRDKSIDFLRLPRNLMGRVIGKQGATINDIRERSGARIDAEDVNDDQCEFKLSGRPDAVARAKAMIMDIADKSGGVPGAGSSGRSENHEGGPDEFTTEVLEYPVAVTGGIIGSGGAKISEVRQQSGAKVQVEKLDDRCKVHIVGTKQQISRARGMIENLAEESQRTDRPRPEVEEAVEVPLTMIGRIIGKGGEMIQKLHKESGARIDVNTKNGDPCPVRISGSREAVSRARNLVLELLERVQANMGGEGMRTGGMAAAERAMNAGTGTVGNMPTETLELPASATGRIIGSGGQAISDVRSQSGARIQVEKLDELCRVQVSGTPDQIDRARRMILTLAEDGSGLQRRGEAEEVLQVPLSMVGRVIGKGGETIQRLQKESCARIDVNTKTGEDPCPVRISGSRDAVARARFMVHEVLDRGVQHDGGGSQAAMPGKGFWGPGSEMGGVPWGPGPMGGQEEWGPMTGMWGPMPGMWPMQSMGPAGGGGWDPSEYMNQMDPNMCAEGGYSQPSEKSTPKSSKKGAEINMDEL